jgi:hypothetical protein
MIFMGFLEVCLSMPSSTFNRDSAESAITATESPSKPIHSKSYSVSDYSTSETIVAGSLYDAGKVLLGEKPTYTSYSEIQIHVRDRWILV